MSRDRAQEHLDRASTGPGSPAAGMRTAAETAKGLCQSRGARARGPSWCLKGGAVEPLGTPETDQLASSPGRGPRGEENALSGIKIKNRNNRHKGKRKSSKSRGGNRTGNHSQHSKRKLPYLWETTERLEETLWSQKSCPDYASF